MRVLILGANGMFGHQLLMRLNAWGHEVSGTIRSNIIPPELESYQLYSNLDIMQSIEGIKACIEAFKPEVIINAIGVIKQNSHTSDDYHKINVDFPRLITLICKKLNIRFIHFSTDCVFSGEVGPYYETSPPNPTDEYGRSKHQGELSIQACNYNNILILRTSGIGPELQRKKSFFEWVLSMKGRKVQGFSQAIYTGLSSIEAVRAIHMVINDFPDLKGLYHLSGEAISKFDMAKEIDRVFDLNIRLEDNPNIKIDRRLDSSRFTKATSYIPPSQIEMIHQLKPDHSAMLPLDRLI